jgi:hypothetical protein
LGDQEIVKRKIPSIPIEGIKNCYENKIISSGVTVSERNRSRNK